MRILITGGGGFLGYHIIKKINNIGNVDYLAPRSSELDILNFNQLAIFLDVNKIDTILHMSAKCGGLLANKNSPADFLRDNTQMALNIFEAAKLNNIKNIYSLGTVCMYPVNCPIPFKEDDIWNGAAEKTNFPYSQAKRTLLMLGQTYREQYGIGGAHLIPVNLFGPKDHFDLINSHVIPALIRKFDDACKNNLPNVQCFGSGSATREFLFASDAADVIIKTVLSGFDSSLPINLGTGKDISIKDLANLIKKLTGYQGEIIFSGAVGDGQPKRRLDVSRAKELLHWEAKTKLEDGLKKTIEWFRASKEF